MFAPDARQHQEAHHQPPESDRQSTYTFECSEKLAKVYFPQFLSDADILAPRELRLWFKEQFEKAAGVYKGI